MAIVDRRLRVLQIAEAANPEWVSVPLVGWNMSRALAKLTDAHLVTQVRNRDALRRAGLVEGQDFTAIDNEQVAGPAWKLAERFRGGAGKGWTMLAAFSALSYYSFEREVWRLFEHRLAAGEFDLVHRITPVSPSHPSPIAKRLAKCGVPFVIGPLNGGVPWPSGFKSRQRAEKEWLSYIRGLYKLLPGYRSTRKYSAKIITGSKHTYDEMPDSAKSKCIHVPENGADVENVEPRNRSAAVPVQAAFVGRLVPLKCVDLLVRAAAEALRDGTLRLHIIGDGPERPTLESLVDREDLRDRVLFHGWLTHDDVQQQLRQCDVLMLPSIREFGGGVVVEAMALGLAAIVADYAGPAELVDDETGIRVPFYDEMSLVEGLKETIEALVRSPETLDRMGVSARQKAERELSWDRKAMKILSIYLSVCQNKQYGQRF